jgi:hypothetical protein
VKKKKLSAVEVPATAVEPGDTLLIEGEAWVKVTKVDPVLDTAHPSLLSDEVVARIERLDGTTSVTLLKGMVMRAA